MKEVYIMKKNALYKIEIENNNGEVVESFNNLDDYNEFIGDLAVEAWDNKGEVSNGELFNFTTWYVIIDNDGDFRSLTSEQFKALA